MTGSPLSNTSNARGLSFTSLVLGILSVIIAIAFLGTSLGPLPLYIAIVCGLLALVIGIIALRRRQPKAPALIGLIAGGLVVLLGLVLIIFALLFVGAFTAGMA